MGWRKLDNCSSSLITYSGDKLKSTSGWNSGGNGTNTSGFTAIPADARYDNSNFDDLGNLTNFWTSSQGGTTFSWGRSLAFDRSLIYHFYYNNHIFAVERIEDYQGSLNLQAVFFN